MRSGLPGPKNPKSSTTKTWWTFRIFFIFFCSGRGKEQFEAPGKGGFRFLIENPRRGVSRGRGSEGPGGCLRRIWDLGGGAKYFFLGAEMSTKKTTTWHCSVGTRPEGTFAPRHV